MRYEIKTASEYHTGVWQLPDFRPVSENVVASPKPYFRDVTEHLFGGVESFREQLIPGNPYWRARLDSACGIDVYGNQGIAVADIDNDGMDEIYVCQPGGLPNRLYKIRADGTAEDITERSGLGVLDETTCAIFADFNNSSRQDVVVLRSSGPLFFVNRGDGTFVEQPNSFQFANPPQGSFTGMAAADFDRDGRLDLYLCCYIYFQSEDQYQYPSPYQDARNGPPNFLFRNRSKLPGGTVVFEDVTAQTGMNHNNDRFSFAPAWCDFDDDGWPDLYVANDFGRGNLYRNRNGHFRDEADKAGLDGTGPGMSAAWFDYDGDGRADLYVSDMWTAPRASAWRTIRRSGQPAEQRSRGLTADTPRAIASIAISGDGKFPRGQLGNEASRDGPLGVGFRRIRLGPRRHTGNSDRRRHGDERIGAIDLESFFWRQVVARSPAAQKPAAIDYENGWSAINQADPARTIQLKSRKAAERFLRAAGVANIVDASGVSGLDLAEEIRAASPLRILMATAIPT